MKLRRKSLFILSVLLAAVLGLCLAACGGKDTVTLSFDSAGGSAVSALDVKPGEEVELETPVKEGYAFEGWYEDTSFSGEGHRGTLTAPEKSTKYYAKWAVGQKLTLDLDGGTSAPAYVWVKPGAGILEALAGIEPIRSGLTFGAWFFEGAEVTASTRMPDSAATVTAKYLADYTIEIYLENLSGTAFVRSDENLTGGRGYVGESCTPAAPAIDHFDFIETPAQGSPVTTLTLSEDGALNVFKHYYTRSRYTVVYDANAPAGSISGSIGRQEGVYEQAMKLEQNPFSREGYRFAGWSTDPYGDVEFTAGQTIRLDASLLLFAVWDKGYTDRYGSPDLIFFPRLEPNKAVLLRGGVEFTGVRSGETFTFTQDGHTMLEGKVFGAQYSYKRNDLADTYVYYANSFDPSVEEQYDETRTLTIDEYLNATYTEGGVETEGSVVYDGEYGDYRFESSFKSFHFLPVHGAQFEYDAVFSVGSEEFGFYVDFTMVDFEEGAGYTTYSMLLALDGYGNASLLDATNMMQYDGRYYVKDKVEIQDSGYYIYKVICRLYDPYGLLTGGGAGYVYNYVYTVPEVDDMYDGYVAADRFYGEYEYGGTEEKAGATLSLDGFGIFEDSAVYTDGDTVVKGAYTTESDLMNGTLVSIYEEGKETPVVFRVDLTGMRFMEPAADDRAPHTAYRFMDGNALHSPFILLYDEDEGQKLAEVYVPSEDESQLVLVGKGTYTSKVLGDDSRFLYVEFTRTWVEKGYEDQVATSLKFYTSNVTSTQTYESYDVYCVLERDGKQYWEKTDLENEEFVITATTVTAGGLGSLYFAADGEIYEGQFTRSASEYGFAAIYGTLLYATPAGELVTRYFELTVGSDGRNVGKELSFTEQMVYVIPEEGTESALIGEKMLFIDSKGNARYTSDSGKNFRAGAYADSEERTVFGETVYALTIGGSVEMKFVLYTLAEYGETPLASAYNEETAGTYTGEAGAELVLDGYYRARLTDADGDSVFAAYAKDGSQLTLFTDAGEELVYTLKDQTFAPIDWASSRVWQLLDNNYNPINNASVAFDGEGGVKIYGEDGKTVISSGTYVALGTVYEGFGYPEYVLRDVSLGNGYPMGNYRVTFAFNNVGVGACLVQNSAALGTFIDEHWNVLTLDGFGRGTIATGEFTAPGLYEVVNKREKFLAFTVDEEAQSEKAGYVYYVVVDAEKGTFFMNDYAEYASFYLASDFASVAFGADGTAYIGASHGPYLVRDGKTQVFLDSGIKELPVPGAESYVYNKKTYYLWDGEELSLSGKVEILDREGKPDPDHPTLDAVMRFTPNGTTNANVAVTFTIGKETYKNFKLRVYASSGDYLQTGGTLSPTVTYEHNTYPVVFTYFPGAQNAFTVKAGYNSVRLLDHNARYIAGDETDKDKNPIYRGGYIEKSTVGFGPIVYKDVVYSGSFYYLYDKDHTAPITFSDIPEKDVLTVGNTPSHGDRKEIVFEYEGTKYAINYYEYYQGGTYYWAYGFYTVEDFETETYTVRLKYLAYTHFSIAPGYVDYSDKDIVNYAIGQPIAATLIEKASGKAVVAYDTGYLAAGYGSGVWLVDKEGIVEKGTTGTCTWGKGYLVTFTRGAEEKITGVTVEEYTFVQVVNYMECLVNLFVDEEGNVTVAGFAVYNADFGRYDWLSNPTNYSDAEDGTVTFKGTWGKETANYTLTITKGEPNDDGDPTYEIVMTKN